MALFQLDPAQFKQLDMQIGGLNGAVNKLAESISPNDSSLHAAVSELSNNLAKWQAEQSRAITAGFASLITILGGSDPDATQQIVDQITNELKSSTDALDSVVKANQPNK
jgi:ABC-type transporter Mla subunit MlaD